MELHRIASHYDELLRFPSSRDSEFLIFFILSAYHAVWRLPWCHLWSGLGVVSSLVERASLLRDIKVTHALCYQDCCLQIKLIPSTKSLQLREW